MNPAYTGLLAALDAGERDALLILADLADEAGDYRRAAAWRQIYEGRMWPRQSASVAYLNKGKPEGEWVTRSWDWWAFLRDSEVEPIQECEPGNTLVWTVFRRLPDPHLPEEDRPVACNTLVGAAWKEYLTASEALQCLAWTLAEDT